MRASAGICVFQIGAASSVATGVSSTFVDLNLTAGPSEARPAGTGVAALASVATSGSIHAGLVVSAVVEILVAEESSPAFLTVALPGLLAGPVEAAWVTNALIAVAPFESHSALALPGFLAEPVLFITSWQTNGFSAVLSLPPGVAHDLPALSTGEVAEGVISRPAEHRTAVPVVVLIAHEAIGILEFGPSSSVQVLGPFLSHSQMPLSGHGADYLVWVLRGEVVFGIGV